MSLVKLYSVFRHCGGELSADPELWFEDDHEAAEAAAVKMHEEYHRKWTVEIHVWAIEDWFNRAQIAEAISRPPDRKWVLIETLHGPVFELRVRSYTMQGE